AAVPGTVAARSRHGRISAISARPRCGAFLTNVHQASARQPADTHRIDPTLSRPPSVPRILTSVAARAQMTATD
ncbi:MAG: hypothetical protein ACRDIL_03085, partial [Candidatus Limnocylindrales bacterium]